MAVRWNRFNRQLHHWGAIVCALPILIVLISGLLLLLKKDIDWIQPPSQTSPPGVPSLDYEQLLNIARSVPAAQVHSWTDIDRLDLRPAKGLIKVRSASGWEIQLHHQTGAIKQVAYRRTDLIESLHDGSFFHNGAKLWIFLPAAIILTTLWITGLYLFALPHLSRRKQRQRQQARQRRQARQEPQGRAQVSAKHDKYSRL